MKTVSFVFAIIVALVSLMATSYLIGYAWSESGTPETHLAIGVSGMILLLSLSVVLGHLDKVEE